MFNRLEGELEAREKSLGLRMADLLTLPDSITRFLRWMIRQKKVSLSEIDAFLESDGTVAKDLLPQMINRGFVREIAIRGETFYRVRMAPTLVQGRMSSIWDALESKVDEDGEK